MYSESFQHTTIGADYLKTGHAYPIDLLLDYLNGLTKLKDQTAHNESGKVRYVNEIIAVKEILKIQTA